jgi:peptide-methionine (S)-S-oxide reductase
MRPVLFLLLLGLALTSLLGCTREHTNPTPAAQLPLSSAPDSTMAIATFGNGCFWCTEAVFEQLRGVVRVSSGYSGGQVENPTYKQVCNGDTGHAEVLQIEYDPNAVSFATLLEVFWKTHDPTTLNRQGNDVGTQYRSVIFTHNPEQERLAREYKAKLDASGAFANPIVTEITPFTKFYPAEDYHQGYFRANGREPYCRYVIAPKVEKFRQVFGDKLKN